MNRAKQLQHYIENLSDFEFQLDVTSGYDHMGAILVDAGLQAGIKYETAVVPRVNRLLEDYPEAKTTSAFQRILMVVGAHTLLDWKGEKKVNTIVDTTLFFVTEGLETVDDLRAWLGEPENLQRLKGIKGIGDKTADYFKILTGISTSAIDRHLYTFFERAGVKVGDYDDAKLLMGETAVLLGRDERTLDYSIWKYMSG